MERVTFDLPGGTFHALSVGNYRAKPLLFLHGFPDHPPTAEKFLGEMATRGFRVLAPWLRGYAPSPTSGVSREVLVDDIDQLVEQWSPDQPVDVVGHDWGAALTYVVCASKAATRVRRAVTMAVPHLRTFARLLRQPAQLRASWYMGLFQVPGSGRIVAARDFALIDRLWRSWSPGFELPADQRRELHACLASSMPGPISWYRSARRDATEGLRAAREPISTPLLYLHGANDACVLPPALDDARDRRWFQSEYVREIVPGVGHFMHLEDPIGIATRIATWLA